MEDVKQNSTDFSVIEFPFKGVKAHPVRFLPTMSFRNCNRTLRSPARGKWIYQWNLVEHVKQPMKNRMCWELLNGTRKTLPTFQHRLFSINATDVLVTKEGFVRGRNEDLNLYAACFSNSKVRTRGSQVQRCSTNVSSIFVASAMWSGETAHFIKETLPRLLTFRKHWTAANNLVHITITDAREKLPEPSPTPMVAQWLRYLNLTAVWGTICARKAFIPMEADCAGGSYMTNMLLSARHWFNLHYRPSKIVIVHRGARRWKNQKQREIITNATELANAMRARGYSNIEIYSPENKTLIQCIPCQLDLFRQTKLLIGCHGAGLANMLFMPPGAAVVEISTKQRDEDPIFGIFTQQAFALGLRFYNYHWHDHPVWPSGTPVERAELNHTKFLDEVDAFLKLNPMVGLENKF